ncbi:hypothetical protein [Maritalea porphyrae]|uniref:hypothetical protein n=1 Tax=Maritalea porphyrae TaxID=880732 RepID=UPI0022AEB50D|nr:hypothetical protein [Maritalea porphyrae]MCZ4270736.1 hypothetical protein [Maritalea porphyrae]
MTYLINDETLVYTQKGQASYRVQFIVDNDPQNPWEDWEGSTPLAVLSFGYGSSSTIKEYTSGHDILNPIGNMTTAYVSRNRKAIFDLLDIDQAFEAFEDECKEYGAGNLADYRRDEFIEALGGMNASDRFEAIAALWEMQGIPAQCTSSNGYSQGDYVELLFVAHPDWIKEIGFKSVKSYVKQCGSTFEGDANTYGAWAWGGVIGYKLDLLDPQDIERGDYDANELQEVEEVNSCWGFYPSGSSDYFPLEKNFAYLIKEIEGGIESHRKRTFKAKSARLAELIKNHVPLHVRQVELAKFL